MANARCQFHGGKAPGAPKGNKHAAMNALNLVKAPVFKKLPRAKNIDLVSPDRADVVKRQSKVQEEENGAMVTHPEDDTLPTSSGRRALYGRGKIPCLACAVSPDVRT